MTTASSRPSAASNQQFVAYGLSEKASRNMRPIVAAGVGPNAEASSVGTLVTVDMDAILYDRECPFCRWSARQILRWDRRHRLRPVALQDPDADCLLPGMDPHQRMQSWHLVTSDGEIHSAGA